MPEETYHNESCVFVAYGIYWENAVDSIKDGQDWVFDSIGVGLSVAQWVVDSAREDLRIGVIKCRCEWHNALTRPAQHTDRPAPAHVMKWYADGALFAMTQHNPAQGI